MARETSFLYKAENGLQLFLVKKLGHSKVNIISRQTITYSKSAKEILEKGWKRWEGCSKLTIETLGRHHLTSFRYLHF